LDQQAEADRHRILSGLESQQSSTTAGTQKSRKGMVTLIVGGAVVLALAAGAGLWLVSEGEKEIVLAGTAPLPAPVAAVAPVAPAAPPATDGPVVRGTADDVPAAAILSEAPVDKQASPDARKQAADDLSKMLEHGTPAAPAKAGEVASASAANAPPASEIVAPRAPARPAKPVRTAAKTPPKKTASAAMPQASNVAPRPRGATVAAKKKPEAKAAAPAPVDSDVALLAALVAHSKATQAKSTGAAAKLRQCKSLATVAEANQCRARVCAGAKGEPECK
jgi:hypothetical protein